MKRMNVVAVSLLAGCLLAGAPVAEAAPKDSAKPASAGGTNSLGQKYDTKLPIEISSDKLEVHQHENRAIFTGNVIAVQGKIRLQADTMIVHYRQKSAQPGQAAPAAPAPGGNRVVTSAPAAEPETPSATPSSTPGGTPPAAATGSPGEMGAISLIEVEGNVFMATPEESAKGDRGDYQTDEKLLHLFGDNVILTRDKNILRGTELVYNLESGESVLTSHGAKVPNEGRVGGLQGSAANPNGGRVHSVFVPNQDNGKSGKGAKVKKPAGSGAAPASTPAASTPAPAAAVPAASGTPAGQ